MPVFSSDEGLCVQGVGPESRGKGNMEVKVANRMAICNVTVRRGRTLSRAYDSNAGEGLIAIYNLGRCRR
jgi:hypothetical protein